MQFMKFFIRECLMFQGDKFQRWLGAMSWMSIVSIILNLIVLLR